MLLRSPSFPVGCTTGINLEAGSFVALLGPAANMCLGSNVNGADAISELSAVAAAVTTHVGVGSDPAPPVAVTVTASNAER